MFKHVTIVIVSALLTLAVTAQAAETYKLASGAYKISVTVTAGGENRDADANLDVTVGGRNVKMARPEEPSKVLSGTLEENRLKVSISDVSNEVDTIELEGELTANNVASGKLVGKTRGGLEITGTFTLKKS